MTAAISWMSVMVKVTCPVAAMFGSPGMQSMVNQMMQNPQLMQNMMSSPYVQTMMNQMMSNPEMASQVMANNPLFASNPQLAESFRQNMPQMMERVSLALRVVHLSIFCSRCAVCSNHSWLVDA